MSRLITAAIIKVSVMFQLAMTFTVAQPVVVRILMKNQVAVTRRVMHLSTKCSHTSVCVSGIAFRITTTGSIG